MLYFFLVLVILGVAALFWLKEHVNNLSKEELIQIEILTEKALRGGLRIRLVRSETMRVPNGSLLVIPLIPIPIGKKEKEIRYFLDVQNAQNKTLLEFNYIRYLNGQIDSVEELEISKELRGIVFLETLKRSEIDSANLAELDVFGDLPFEISELGAFVSAHRDLMRQAFKLPIGLIVHYGKPSEEVFKLTFDSNQKAQASPYFTMSGLNLTFTPTREEKALVLATALSMKLKKNRLGLIDLSQAPEMSESFTPAQKDYLLGHYKRIGSYRTKDGMLFKTFVEKANRAFSEKIIL